ncbi:hypothetical protein R6Q57_006122, partial [Mikania cordata]
MKNTRKGNQASFSQVFGSREEMMDWVQNLAYSLGVVVVTKRSNKRPCGFFYKIVLRCDRGEFLAPKNTRGRPSMKKSQQKRRDDPARQDSRRYSCDTKPNFVGLESIKEPARHSSYELDLNKQPMLDLNE